MWKDTAITRMLGIQYPMIQAPMAGRTTTTPVPSSKYTYAAPTGVGCAACESDVHVFVGRAGLCLESRSHCR